MLADATRLVDRGGAPFEAMAESCASDVRGKWDPFERAVRAEGRQAGLTRPRLPVVVQAPLYVGAGVIGVLAFLAVDAVPHTSGVVAPLVAAFFAFIIPVTMVGSLSQKDRPTGARCGHRRVGGAGGRGRRRWLASPGPGAHLHVGRAERAGAGGRRR